VNNGGSNILLKAYWIEADAENASARVAQIANDLSHDLDLNGMR
jgi:hypothetical protein